MSFSHEIDISSHLAVMMLMTMIMNHDPDDDKDVGDVDHPDDDEDVGDVDHPDDDYAIGDVDQPDEEIPHALNACGSNRRNLEIKIY